jgi:hypothetical protein
VLSRAQTNSSGNNRFEEAADNLLDSSLVRINAGLIAVHGLIQESYFAQMTAESRRESFQGALTLLRAHFPRQHGARHLYAKWDRCGTLQQHVVALSEHYRHLKALGELSTGGADYTELVLDNTW